MVAAWMVRLGTGGSNAEELIETGYLGVDYIGDYDIRPHLGHGSEAFRKAMSPVFLDMYPDKTKVAAGRAMGNLHAATQTMQVGDLVLAPTGTSNIQYNYGVVSSDYEFHPGKVQPHRRRVEWKGFFSRELMSPNLRAAAANPQTVSKFAPAHAGELAELTGVTDVADLQALIPEEVPAEVQDPLAFQMEKQLEDFLVHNWRSTVLGRDYNIYATEEEGVIGQQYRTDTGPVDILAISKDKSRLLVVELKRGRASDIVVGQIQRYMGFAQAELAEPGQTVEGVIIAQDDDVRIRRALLVAPRIRFMRYRVEFHLEL